MVKSKHTVNNHNQSLLKLQKPQNQHLPICNPRYLDFQNNSNILTTQKTQIIPTKYLTFLYYRLLNIRNAENIF